MSTTFTAETGFIKSRPRRVVRLAQAALDASGRLLLGRDGGAAIDDDDVRRVGATARQEVLQVLVGHAVKAAEMPEQRRTVDADEPAPRAVERGGDGQVGRQVVVEVLCQVVGAALG
jgi:hypothetical protein